MKMLNAITGRLGQCPRCMRQAFAAAAASMMAGAVSWVWFGASIPTAIVCLAASGLVCLWVGHLIAYASRASARSPVSEDEVRDPSRRALFPTFMKTFAAVAVATALPGVTFAQNYRLDEQCEGRCDDLRTRCYQDECEQFRQDQQSYIVCSKKCYDQWQACASHCY